MATTTTNYNLNKPTPGGDTDTWGDLLNTSMDLIDTQMKANADAVAGLGDPVTVAHGGTGATTESDARSALGLGTAATQSDSKYPHRANNLNDLNDKGAARVNIGANSATNLTTGTLPIARIADGDVTNAKLASGINASKLTTGTLPIARIANGDVTNAKLASGIDAAKLTTGILPIARIADGAVTVAKGGTGASTAAAARTNLGLETEEWVQTSVSSGDFTNGTIRIQRVGKQVTMDFIVLIHDSSNVPASANNYIPESLRPAAEVGAVYDINSIRVRHIIVNSAGRIQLSYRNWSGDPSATTSSGAGTISWVTA